MHRGRLASPRAVDLSARAARDSPRSYECPRGRRGNLSDPVSAPRGAVSSPKDAVSGPKGAFSTPRMLVSGLRGSAKWSDARSSSPKPDGSKHKLARSERQSSSRRSAQQYSLRPTWSRSESPPRPSAEQRRDSSTRPMSDCWSMHSAEQPRHRLGTPKPDRFSKWSAELPMPRQLVRSQVLLSRDNWQRMVCHQLRSLPSCAQQQQLYCHLHHQFSLPSRLTVHAKSPA
ncbi:TPA: hypothetical protein ACH3X1_012683 [Trebouxia sp. C0004]